MTLQECLNALARGRISNLSLCSDGYVKPEYLEKVIDALNEGVQRIHSAITIRESYFVIDIDNDQEEQELPFDLMVLSTIFDDKHETWAINDPDKPKNLFADQRKLVVKNKNQAKELWVFYRVKPQRYSTADLDTEVEIPDSLIGALLSYAAYLLHSDLNTELAINNSQKYLNEYQTIINQAIQQNNINHGSIDSNNKLDDRGFV